MSEVVFGVLFLPAFVRVLHVHHMSVGMMFVSAARWSSFAMLWPAVASCYYASGCVLGPMQSQPVGVGELRCKDGGCVVSNGSADGLVDLPECHFVFTPCCASECFGDVVLCFHFTPNVLGMLIKC